MGSFIQAGLYYVMLQYIRVYSLPVILAESTMGVILYGAVVWMLEKRRIVALIVNLRNK